MTFVETQPSESVQHPQRPMVHLKIGHEAGQSAAIDAPEKIDPMSAPVRMEARELDFYYGSMQALKKVSLRIPDRMVTALIGPSGCGKSTFLRCFNRMNDMVATARIEGQLELDGESILGPSVNVIDLRRRVGMVFQKSNPFPVSIFENVAYGLRILGWRNRREIAERVEESLRNSALWDEVKDRLQHDAYALSGGQQQRLCIARALALRPEVLLMDEPTSALDPVATQRIEELVWDLKKSYTIVMVTHNMQQAARVSDVTAFFYMGELIEADATSRIFTNPRNKQTEDYVTGRFG